MRTTCVVTAVPVPVSKLAKVPSANPDLILMDINLAGSTTGIKTAVLLNETVDISTIFLTAYSDPKPIEKAAEAEPFGYIIKPFDDRELREPTPLRAFVESSLRRVAEAGVVPWLDPLQLLERHRRFAANLGDALTLLATVALALPAPDER